MELEGLPGEVGQRAGDTVAGEGVEAAGGVAGGLGCHALAFDDGAGQSGLSQVPGRGASGGAAPYDCYVG